MSYWRDDLWAFRKGSDDSESVWLSSTSGHAKVSSFPLLTGLLGNATDLLYLDFLKVLDKVSHVLLLDMTVTLARWLWSQFGTHWMPRVRVAINGSVYTCKVSARVPQGSVLGLRLSTLLPVTWLFIILPDDMKLGKTTQSAFKNNLDKLEPVSSSIKGGWGWGLY